MHTRQPAFLISRPTSTANPATTASRAFWNRAALSFPTAAEPTLRDRKPCVEAERMGGFGGVIGVDRAGQPHALRQAGAHVVVADLDEIGVL
jgi:hypothetical protein